MTLTKRGPKRRRRARRELPAGQVSRRGVEERFEQARTLRACYTYSMTQDRED